MTRVVSKQLDTVSLFRRWTVAALSRRLTERTIVAHATRLLLCGLLLSLLDVQDSPAANDLTLTWENGHLVATGNVPQSASRVIGLINERHFDDALQQIEVLDLDNYLRGQLAVSGHLDISFPTRALKVAEKFLGRAADDPNAVPAKRLLNQAHVYQTLSNLILPWARSSPGHCWIPSPRFLTCRDLEAIRYNLPMVTSEVRGTDRISLEHFSLVGPLSLVNTSRIVMPAYLTVGSSVPGYYLPQYPTTVRSRQPRSIWSKLFQNP